jgi:murein endopeptidase
MFTSVMAKLTVVIATVLAAAALALLIVRGEDTAATEPAAVTTAPPAVPTVPPTTAPAPPPPTAAPQRALPSRALGLPYRGRLVRGVQLPAEGPEFFTWDPILKSSPNRGWRRWGTDRLLDTLSRVLAEYRKLHPNAPRVAIGDLSRPHGGDFGPRFGAPGHASHQNGLDVDVYYPRNDRLERRAYKPELVDGRLAQDLVDLFVAHGAQFVFVGPRLDLRGPKRVVQPLPLHDDHLHVRIRRR